MVATYPDNRVLEKVVSLENLYDTPMFEQAYTYTGTLGVSFDNNQTIFRLWAPLSESVTLNLYNQGHPNYDNSGSEHLEETPYETHELNQIENGAWEIKLDGNFMANTIHLVSPMMAILMKSQILIPIPQVQMDFVA